MSEGSPRKNFSFLLWLVALLPMGACGCVMLAVFALNLSTTRQNSQPLLALTRTRAALTSRALSLTSVARSQYTAQVRSLTTTAIAQNFSEASQYPLVFSDAFETSNKKWVASAPTLTQSEGKYKWQLQGNAIHLAIIDAAPTAKFYLSVELRLLKDMPNSDYGLVFRQNGPEFYALTITSGQLYRVNHYSLNSPRLILASRGRSNAIRPAEVNRLTVIGDGPNYALYINGQYVDQL
jgi:hypothetical protein